MDVSKYLIQQNIIKILVDTSLVYSSNYSIEFLNFLLPFVINFPYSKMCNFLKIALNVMIKQDCNDDVDFNDLLKQLFKKDGC